MTRMPVKTFDIRTDQRSYCWLSQLLHLCIHSGGTLTLVPTAVEDFDVVNCAGRASVHTEIMAIMAQAMVKRAIPSFTKEVSLETSEGLTLLDCRFDAPVTRIATPVETMR